MQRERFSTFLQNMGVLCLGAAFVLLGFTWLVAWRQGVLPTVGWEEHALRGPWSNNDTLEHMVQWTLAASCIAAAFSALAMVFNRQNARVHALLLTSIAFFVLVLYAHIGLLDD